MSHLENILHLEALGQSLLTVMCVSTLELEEGALSTEQNSQCLMPAFRGTFL